MTDDVETLEEAMRLFFQTMKRPHTWSLISKRARTTLDRPSAAILHALLALPSGRCRVHDLATLLGIEAPSVTRKTQELELAGYVRRVPDKNDRRAVTLQVTASGKAVTARIRKAQHKLVSEALAEWDKASRKEFAVLFERFSRSLADAAQEK